MNENYGKRMINYDINNKNGIIEKIFKFGSCELVNSRVNYAF